MPIIPFKWRFSQLRQSPLIWQASHLLPRLIQNTWAYDCCLILGLTALVVSPFWTLQNSKFKWVINNLHCKNYPYIKTKNKQTNKQKNKKTGIGKVNNGFLISVSLFWEPSDSSLSGTALIQQQNCHSVSLNSEMWTGITEQCIGSKSTTLVAQLYHR